MNCIIDIGNSLYKLAIFSENELIDSISESLASISQLEKINSTYPQIKNTIICSTTGHNNNIINYIKKEKKSFLLLDHTTPIPITNLYKSKQSLGYDRIAAVIGANFLFPDTHLLVIDSGTAITFDFLNSKKEYLGGNISLGLSMRFKALNHFTQKLPLIDVSDTNYEIGEDTQTAITAGVINGITYEIDTYIDKFKLKYPNGKIIFTGGDSKYLVKKLKNSIFVDEKLVLIGLNIILNYNVKS